MSQGLRVSSHEDLLEYTTARWQVFIDAVDGLPENVWVQPVDAAGWTVKDHIAHVVAWDVAVVRLIDDHVPLQSSLGSPDGEWDVNYDAINERLRQRTLGLSVAELRSWRDSTWKRLLASLSSLTDQQLAAPAAELGFNTEPDDTTALLDFLVGYQGGHYDAHLSCVLAIAASEQD